MKEIKEPNFISKNTKKNLLIVVNIILLVALLSIATYAWFFRNLADNVDTEDIQFASGLSLQVSLTNKDEDFDYNQTLVKGTHYSESALSKEITGDGIETHFMRPLFSNKDDQTELFTPNLTPTDGKDWDNYQTMSPDSDYIVKTLYFRSTVAVDIYLTKNSYVKGLSEIPVKSETGTEILPAHSMKWNSNDVTDTYMNQYRISDKADSDGYKYSKDCVVGATRVAFTDDSETRLLWLPRPDVFFNLAGDAEKGYNVRVTAPMDDDYGENMDNYFRNIPSTSSEHSFPYLVPGSGEHWYFTKIGGEYVKNPLRKTMAYDVNNHDTVKGYVAGTSDLPDLNSKKPIDGTKLNGYIGTTTKANAEDKYFTTQVNVAIWVDGFDAEARKELVGGKFKAKFQFLGIPI